LSPFSWITTRHWVALVQAVRDDITSTLTAQSAEIVEESGNPIADFQIRYAAGKSEGQVCVEPLKSVTGHPNSKLCNQVRTRLQFAFAFTLDEKGLKS
jgi:hypothetical protein